VALQTICALSSCPRIARANRARYSSASRVLPAFAAGQIPSMPRSASKSSTLRSDRVSHVHHHDQTDDLRRAVEIAERVAHGLKLPRRDAAGFLSDSTLVDCRKIHRAIDRATRAENEPSGTLAARGFEHMCSSQRIDPPDVERATSHDHRCGNGTAMEGRVEWSTSKKYFDLARIGDVATLEIH
jgi:hypothetical protein